MPFKTDFTHLKAFLGDRVVNPISYRKKMLKEISSMTFKCPKEKNKVEKRLGIIASVVDYCRYEEGYPSQVRKDFDYLHNEVFPELFEALRSKEVLT